MSAHAPAAGARSRPGVQAEAGPILVVEDDDDIRDLVELVLRNEGYAVEAAPNGAAALRSIDRAPPRAIILDMKMPVMDGWAFARQYHERGGAEAPIIVMTAAHDPHKRAAQVCAFDVLIKPFDVNDLLVLVARAIHHPA